MFVFYGKKIILGIIGSIVVYKVVLLVWLLIKVGVEVQVFMIVVVVDFIIFFILVIFLWNKVYIDVVFGDSWNNYVEMGFWVDVMVFVFLIVIILVKLLQGICDNIIVVIYFFVCCFVFFVLVMDLDMWKYLVMQENVSWLQCFGNQLIFVGIGELVSGLVGEGCMVELEIILVVLDWYFSRV